MLRYRIRLAYDGTDYHGWQAQPGRQTVQAELEEALATMAKQPIRATGSGRTDAGVHADDQVAHFDLAEPIPSDGLLKGLNSLLPGDIRVVHAIRADERFHARYDVVRKVYRYHLDRRPVPSPLRRRFAWHFPYELDQPGLDLAAALFVGHHDFSAFRAASCTAKTTDRQVEQSHFLRIGSELVYEVSGNGFLQHMVRNMLGTLIEVGRRKRAPEDIERLLGQTDRRLAGPTAPPTGLILHRVDYGEEVNRVDGRGPETNREE